MSKKISLRFALKETLQTWKDVLTYAKDDDWDAANYYLRCQMDECEEKYGNCCLLCVYAKQVESKGEEAELYPNGQICFMHTECSHCLITNKVWCDEGWDNLENVMDGTVDENEQLGRIFIIVDGLKDLYENIRKEVSD